MGISLANCACRLIAGLANELTDLRTDWLPDWLCARNQNFPTCSPPRHISAGERCLVPSQCLQCRAMPWEYSPASSPHSAWNASPTAAINQQQRPSFSLSRLSFFSSLLYAHRHAGWGHSERVNRCRLICLGLSDIARVMYLMWSLFSSNKCIKNYNNNSQMYKARLYAAASLWRRQDSQD